MSKLKNWYSQLKTYKKLLVWFLFYFVFWFPSQLFMGIIGEEAIKLNYKGAVLGALFMSIFWLFLFHWKLLKKLFSRKETITS
jgi:membrane associated rhomboid family serine protease